MRKVFVISAILFVFASISISCVSGVQYTAEVATPPIVANPSANSPSIVADGIQESQLNVTVTDASGIYSVTVNLSALGGLSAKEMTNIAGTEIYTITTTAAVGTPPGTYNLQVNATDNSTNRNSNTSVGIPLTVTAPVPETYAIWANSTTRKHAIQWFGSKNVVNGNVHSNNDIKVSGSSNMLIGTTEHVSTFTDSGGNNTFIPPPIKVSPEPFPIQYNISNYKPNGLEAIAAGDKYHHIEGRNFHVSGSDVVLDGLYYAEGDAKLSGSNISGVFTIVAEGKIDVSGSTHNCSAYSGNLLFFSNDTKFKIAAGKSYFGGIIYIPKGEIEISGAKNMINGGLFADTVRLSGSELNINAAHLNPKSTVETTQTSGDNISIFIKALKAILQFFRGK